MDTLLPDLCLSLLPAWDPLQKGTGRGILSTQHQDLLISGELFWGSRYFLSRLAGSVFGPCYQVSYRRNVTN